MKKFYEFPCPGKNPDGSVCGIKNRVELDDGETRTIPCLGCCHDVWYGTIHERDAARPDGKGKLVEKYHAGVGPGPETRKRLSDAKEAGGAAKHVFDHEKEERGTRFSVTADPKFLVDGQGG